MKTLRKNLLLVAVLWIWVLCGAVWAAEDGLVSHWTFDEGSGTTAYDSAGDNNGTLVGDANWTTGVTGGALRFDGVGDYVEVDSSEELKLNLTGTISVWIYPHDLYRHTIVEKKGAPGGGNRGENYFLTFGSSNQCVLNIGDGSTYVSAEIAAESFSVNSWYHIVGTWNSSNIMIYLNGELQDIQTNTLSYLISSDSYPVRIGAHDSLTWFFDGKIDDVRIYDRFLSAEEIEELYQDGYLVELEIAGPNKVAENFSANYKAIAHHVGGSSSDVTGLADWLVEPNMHAIIEGGLLATEGIDRPEEDMTINAQYTAGDVTVEAVKEISVFAICLKGAALEFDGDDDYVLVPDSDSISVGNQDYTLSAWIRPNTTGFAIVSKVKGPADKEYGFTVQPDGNIYLKAERNSNNQEARTTTSPITTSIWQHVAATFDSSTTTPVFYYNGAVQASTSNINTLPDELDDDLYIGKAGGTYTGGHIDGLIDDVRIYNRVLSAEEIRAGMHQRVDVNEPNLVGYWDFDEGEGQIAYDMSGNGNNGYLGSDPCEPDDRDPAWFESDAPISICTPEGFVERNISDARDIKMDIIELLGIALEKERAAEDVLNILFKNWDFGSVKKRDVNKAKQNIHSAMQREEQAETTIDRSIEELEDSLSLLGCEVEPRSWTEPEEENEAVIRADINADGVIDFRDFTILSEHWLKGYKSE
ncbi:MAG: LamG domain-containing protein [Planctomycetota bacterium]|jgi:hypothetical protein